MSYTSLTVVSSRSSIFGCGDGTRCRGQAGTCLGFGACLCSGCGGRSSLRLSGKCCTGLGLGISYCSQSQGGLPFGFRGGGRTCGRVSVRRLRLFGRASLRLCGILREQQTFLRGRFGRLGARLGLRRGTSRTFGRAGRNTRQRRGVLLCGSCGRHRCCRSSRQSVSLVAGVAGKVGLIYGRPLCLESILT